MWSVQKLTSSVGALLLLVACGSGGSMQSSAPAEPAAPAMTPVSLVVSSTANDQLTEFDIAIQGISLTSASGRQVSIVSKTQQAEFIHLNGAVEPLLTASIPSDLYTAATVTVGSAAFMCVGLQADGGLVVALYTYGQTPTANVSASLSTPISAGTYPVVITLDMLVSRSASWSGCGTSSSYVITPTFRLSALDSASAAPGPQSQSVRGVDGEVTALDSGSGGFHVSLATSAASVHISVGRATVWQGIGGATDLHTGMFVDLDGALSSDGSITASRVAVADTAAVNVQRGPLLFVSDTAPTLDMYPRQQQGKDRRIFTETFSFDGSRFQVSGELNNLQALPFEASFSANNMVPGQSVYVSTPAFGDSGTYYAVANTVTLVPQTVNGTVTVVGVSGDFTVYRVSLASYDLLSLLALAPGQATRLSDPGVLEVYADTHTAMLTASAPAAGDTLRFYGLVFNDHGALRMDCARISPGVSAL